MACIWGEGGRRYSLSLESRPSAKQSLVFDNVVLTSGTVFISTWGCCNSQCPLVVSCLYTRHVRQLITSPTIKNDRSGLLVRVNSSVGWKVTIPQDYLVFSRTSVEIKLSAETCLNSLIRSSLYLSLSAKNFFSSDFQS